MPIKKLTIAVTITLCFIVLFSNLSTAITSIPKDELERDLSFKDKIQALMKKNHMPSLVASVIKNDSIVYSNAFGYSNILLRRKASIETIYVIGSISKTILSTALMQLVEQEKIGLDENISHFFPFDIKNPKYPKVNITLRMLLAHQSSLNYDFTHLILSYPFPDDAMGWIKEHIIPGEKKYSEKLWCDFKPGEESMYSNIGYLIAGEILENITNKSVEEYCQENIFKPLGMDNTSFSPSNFDNKNVARPYIHLIGPFHLPLPYYDLNCANVFAGVRTNVLDLSRFVMMHMNNGSYKNIKILNSTTIEEMHKIQYPNSTMSMYDYQLRLGLGWLYLDVKGVTYSGYNGGAYGYCCNILIDEKNNSASLTLSNFHFSRIGFREMKQLKLDVLYEIDSMLLEKAV